MSAAAFSHASAAGCGHAWTARAAAAHALAADVRAATVSPSCRSQWRVISSTSPRRPTSNLPIARAKGARPP